MPDNVLSRRGFTSVHVNGIDVAFRDVGSGRPLILLHGALVSHGPLWSGSNVAWVDQIAPLSDRFRVIAPDTRGSGATAHTGGPATFKILAADVLGLIDALALERPIVAGFSEGGATATALAISHPDRIGALVNLAGFDYFDWQPNAEENLRTIFGGHPDARQADPDAADRIFQAEPMMAHVFATMKTDYDDAQGPHAWKSYLHQFFNRTVAGVGYDLAALSRLQIPTLFLAGDRDHFCSPEMAVRAYRAAPGSMLALLPETGHEITPLAVQTMLDVFDRLPA